MRINSRFWRFSLLVCCLAVCDACGSDSSTAPSTPIVSFVGNYTGTYGVTTCSDGAGGALCSGIGFTPGARFPITLSLGQTNTSVSGNVILGSLSGTFQGVANSTNLSGTAAMNTITFSGSTAAPNLTAWNTTLTGNALTGTFTVSLVIAGIPGTLVMNAGITQLSR